MVTIFELFRPEEYFSLNVRVNMGGSNLNLTWLDGERITDRGQLTLMEQAIRQVQIDTVAGYQTGTD